MTWIIGFSTAFGYSAGLSDIQVTYVDRTTADCLRKIYPVGRYIALGFSGSVAIGFKMVETLSHFLKDIPPKMGWDPAEVAKWWQVDAQDVFRSFPTDEKKLGCELILLGVHPAIREKEFANRAELYKMISPVFTPVRARPFQFLSIGSGNRVKTYIRRVRQFSKYPDGAMQIETTHPGGMATAVKYSLTRTMTQNPAKGISGHLHLCTVWANKIELGTNDMRYINSPGATDYIMPPVAASYEEFQKLAQTQGIIAECARC